MDADAAAGRSLSLPGWALVIVVWLQVVLIVLLLVRRHRIEPAAAPAAA